MTVPLSDMKAGQSGRVETFTGSGEIYHRLLEMGLTQGTPIEVVRFAPLGDPIDIRVRGYHLSLRKSEAEVVQVSLRN